jgi:hypothetical protein
MPDPLLDQLRQPSTPPMNVDRAAVIEGGRRRVRRRSLRWAGAALAAAAVIAAVAWPVGRLWDSLPWVPPAASGRVLTVAESDETGERVELRRQDGGTTADAYVVGRNGSTVASLGAVGLADPAKLPALKVHAGARWAVAVTPGSWSRPFPVFTGVTSVGAAWHDAQRAPTGALVTAFEFTEPFREARSFPLLAVDGDSVVSSTGEGPDVLELSDQLTVVRFQQLGFFGTLSGGTLYGSLVREDDPMPWQKQGVTIPGLGAEGTTVVLLPDGADQVSVVPRFDFQSYDGEYETRPMPGGGVVLFLGLTEVALDVSWTDEAGTRHTRTLWP